MRSIIAFAMDVGANASACASAQSYLWDYQSANASAMRSIIAFDDGCGCVREACAESAIVLVELESAIALVELESAIALGNPRR